MAYACVFHRSELLFRDRFNLSAADRYLAVEEVVALGALVLVGGPFFCCSLEKLLEVSVQEGLHVQALLKPLCSLLYTETKALVGKEDRTQEGEALGRKLANVFFQDAGGGLVRRVHRDSLGVQQHCLNPC